MSQPLDFFNIYGFAAKINGLRLLEQKPAAHLFSSSGSFALIACNRLHFINQILFEYGVAFHLVPSVKRPKVWSHIYVARDAMSKVHPSGDINAYHFANMLTKLIATNVLSDDFVGFENWHESGLRAINLIMNASDNRSAQFRSDGFEFTLHNPAISRPDLVDARFVSVQF